MDSEKFKEAFLSGEEVTVRRSQNPVEIKRAITVIEKIHLTLGNEVPQSVDNSYTLPVSYEDEDGIYTRRKVRVTDKWLSLDSGWLKSCSFLCIRNHAGETPNGRTPKLEDLDLYSHLAVEVGFMQDGGAILPALLIKPATSLRLTPLDLVDVHLRCPEGECQVSYSIIPG